MNTTDDGLLPCPWCAQKPIVEHIRSREWRCGCVNIDCEAQPDILGPTREYTIAAWNTHTTPSLVTDDEATKGYWGPDVDGDWVVNILGVGFAFAVADEEKAQEIVTRIRELAASDRDVLVGRIAELEDKVRSLSRPPPSG